MKIYRYHPHSRVYLGEDFADESPLEKGVFLIPANSTIIKPPIRQEGKIIKFIDSNWIYEDISNQEE